MTRSFLRLLTIAAAVLPLRAQSLWDGGAGTGLWSDASNGNPSAVCIP